ncbi:unnamed protein product, partial [Prorocentrum cordatum]
MAPPPADAPPPAAAPPIQVRLDGWPQPTSEGLRPRRRLLVGFAGEAFPYGRLVITAHPGGGSAWALTTDDDACEEDYRNDPDIVNVTFLDDAGRPSAPPRQLAHASRGPPPQAALPAAAANAEVQTQLLGWGKSPRDRLHQLEASSFQAVAACMLALGASAPLFVEWVASQRVASFRDEEIYLCASEVSDCRAMKPRFERGVRNRGFNDGVVQMFEEPGLDGSPKGPRVALGTATALRSQGRSAHECKLICEVLHALQRIDQCNPPSLAGAELLVRMGWAGTRGAGSTPDALMSYATNRLKDKAAIMKEKRKAIDESRHGGKGKPDKGRDVGGK